VVVVPSSRQETGYWSLVENRLAEGKFFNGPGDLLIPRDEPSGIVAGVAAEVIPDDFDSAVADRRRAEEVYGQPREMGQALARGRMLNRPADECRGRTGVLMLGMPRAAGERASGKDAVSDFVIGCVQ
jgi:hypothetical protein